MTVTALPPPAPEDHPDTSERAVALEQIQACAARLGRDPSMRDFDRDPHSTITARRAARLFGGWNHAKRQAGLGVRRHRTDTELLAALSALHHQLGRTPNPDDVRASPLAASPSLYARRFGTLTQALAAAGAARPAADTGHARALAVLHAGVTLTDRLGRLPSFADWRDAHRKDPSIPSEWQARRAFGGPAGSWNLLQMNVLDACRQAGVTVTGTAPANRPAT